MLDNFQFRQYILQPTLKALQLNPSDYEELMVGTFAQESLGCTYIRQIDNGVGLGPFSMQPQTHDDIWNVVLPNNPMLTYNLMLHCMLGINKPKPELMMYHLTYATAMAAICYFRFHEEKPKKLDGMAAYWKKYYNTQLGKGTEEEFVENYLIFTGAKNEKQKTHGKK